MSTNREVQHYVQDHQDTPLILFQGDSVTDCGRERGNDLSFGAGYPALVAGHYGVTMPGVLRFVNRGVSGDRVKDLKARWNEDCLSLRPAMVSILIGINDVWRRYDSNDPTDVDAFYSVYRQILSQVSDTGAAILMLEPFVLPVPEDRKTWREDLDPKIQAVRELAREYADVYIPLDGIFAEAGVRVDPAYWAADGVHPTLAGHGLIAKKWIAATEELLPILVSDALFPQDVE